MNARLGIELSPSACRIVELDGPQRRGRDARDTRVRSFSVLPPADEETRAAFAGLHRRSASVIVWNAWSEHRQVVVSGGTYESMRDEALGALAVAGLRTQGVVADIAPVVGPPARGVRQPVVVVLASAQELAEAVRPLRAAGIRLRSVTTPAVALASLARERRALSVPGAMEVYIALERNATCVALVRDAVLVAAHTLAWGYEDAESGAARPRDEIASRLAEGVTDFVGAIGGGARDIGQVCICGGLPELRSMTLPLMERLDVEVEPLDSLFGIDAAKLPEPADEFRERSVELRLAWAVAADWPPPINLLRGQRRRASKTLMTRAAIAAGIVAGLAAGWGVQGSSWWRSRAQTPAPHATAPRATAPTAARTAPPFVPPPDAGPARPPVVARSAPPFVPPPDVGPAQPPVVARSAPPFVPPPDVGPTRPPVVARSAPPFVPPPDVGPTRPPVVARSAPPFVPPPDVGPTRPPVVVRSAPPFVPPPDVGPTRPPVVARSAPPFVPPPDAGPTRPPVVARSAPPFVPPPDVGPRRPPAPATPAPSRTAAAPVVRQEPPPAPRAATPPPVRTEPAPAAARTAPATRGEPAPPVRSEPAPRPAEAPGTAERAPRVEAPAPTPAERTAPRAEAGAGRPSAAPPRGKTAPPETALPFDAVLGTILYSPDRKLAIVDGRIVGVGDQVRGARVTDITASAVLLRDAQGRLRQLTLGAGGR